MRLFRFLTAVAALLMLTAPASAQFGHPLKGTWIGEWGPNKEHVVVEIKVEGGVIAGTVNPGANGIPLKVATLDPSKWTVHFEAEGKDRAGATVRYVIDGKVENLGRLCPLHHRHLDAGCGEGRLQNHPDLKVRSPWRSLGAAFSPPPRSPAPAASHASAPRRRRRHRCPRFRRRATGRGGDPVQYPDPDIVALDNRFRRYIVGNTVDQAGCTPARCGPKVRRGTASAASWCGATFRTTSRCAGSRKTAASPCSAIRPATATATRSISKAASSPASTAAAASCATSTTER